MVITITFLSKVLLEVILTIALWPNLADSYENSSLQKFLKNLFEYFTFKIIHVLSDWKEKVGGVVISGFTKKKVEKKYSPNF